MITRRPAAQKVRPEASANASIKRWIWIYFWLLIFEGALRKWVVPQANQVLLVVRDPIVLIIYWKVYQSGRMRNSSRLLPFALLSLALVSLAVLQIASGINPPLIAAYGLRCYLLHIPLVYVMAQFLSAEDVKQFGRWFLLLSIPMGVLVFAQYRATPDSWLNAGLTGEFEQIAFTEGHVRASGTFSFVTGTTCFLSFVSAFLLYSINSPRLYCRWIIWPSTLLTLAALPAVGSRTAIFSLAGIILFALLAALRCPKTLAGLIKPLAFVCLAGAALTLTPIFREAASSFQSRWTDAADSEGGVNGTLHSRVVDTVGNAFDSDDKTSSPIGHGIGMGSNVASVLQSGSSGFLLAEGEWQRVLLEFGPIFGLLFMGLRVLFCADLGLQSFRALSRGSSLSWLLFAAVAPMLILQVMEQPTNLGFMIFGSGLCFAALSDRKAAVGSSLRARMMRYAAPSRAPLSPATSLEAASRS